ncbi:MAG: ABC transporter ATP-binding protein [Athalassotoga sp.]
MPDKYAVEVEEIKKAYKTRKHLIEAIKGVTFKIEYGSITGILGPNGAGKTTLLKMVVGTIFPDNGSLKVLGVSNPVRHMNLLAPNIGVVLEGSRNIYGPLTCEQNIKYFARLHGYKSKQIDQEINSLLDYFSILDKKNVPAMKLSRGMQQKLAICTALIHKPKLLLLDEPTLGLDVQSSIDLVKVLRKINREIGVTILLTSHDLRIIQDLSTHLLMLKEGKIILNEKINNALSMFDKRRFCLASATELNFANIDYIRIEESRKETESFEYVIEVDKEKEQEFLKLIFSLQEKGVHFSTIRREEVNVEDIFFEVMRGDKKK